jgi:peptidoglycan/LPS O-acetylase OafA/YrhL
MLRLSNTSFGVERGGYRPEIDGLRALAVIAVILYHARLGLPGGFVGVDVFFVISGYLITSLLLEDLKKGRLNLLAFWERRIRRLFPAVVVVTLTTLVAGWFFLLPGDYGDLAQSVFSQMLLSSNFFFWKNTNYFDGLADLKPLLHTWSLSVEEQFYLLYPFALILLSRVGRKFAVASVAILLSIELALSVYGVSHHPFAAFYLLPFRAWELGLGAILATARGKTHWAVWFNETLSTIGLALILYVFFSRSISAPGIAVIPVCLGTAVFIYVNTAKLTLVGKFLCWRPFVSIGLVSYSLYLWHWPVLVFANYWALGPLSFPVRILLVGSSLVLAMASWKFVETPFRRAFPGRKRVLIVASIVAFAFLMLSLTIQKLDGVKSRLPVETLRYANARFDFNPAFNSNLSLQDVKAGRLLLFGSNQSDIPVDLLVWGDSHAWAILPPLDDLSKQHSTLGCAATHAQTPPLLDYVPDGDYSLGKDAPAFGQAVLSFIRAHHVSNVLLAAGWQGYSTVEKYSVFHAAFVKTITALRESGAKVWLMEDVPNFPWDVPKALARVALFKQGTTEMVSLPLSEYLQQLGREVREFSPFAGSQVILLSPLEYLSRGIIVPSCFNDGMPLYRDANHLTIRGAMAIRPMFLPIFSR